MAAGTRSRSTCLPFLSLLLLLLPLVSISSSLAASGSRGLLGYVPAARRRDAGGGPPAPNCREMASRSECERRSKWCRWCRSDALDDMCFGAAEAWRLPKQVFSCQPTAASSSS